MRNALTIAAVALMLPGCALFQSGPSEAYIRADRITHDAIAPEYRAYVEADPTLDEGQKEARRLNVESWGLRLETAEEGIAP